MSIYCTAVVKPGTRRIKNQGKSRQTVSCHRHSARLQQGRGYEQYSDKDGSTSATETAHADTQQRTRKHRHAAHKPPIKTSPSRQHPSTTTMYLAQHFEILKRSNLQRAKKLQFR